MRSEAWKGCWLLALAALAVPSVAWAQVGATTGSIQGVVKDPTGAVVADATVTLIHPARGERRQTATREDGSFAFPLVLPGRGYQVEVERTGFRRAISPNIAVEVTEVTRVSIVLSLGTVSEQVVVEGGIQLVETTNATLGDTVPSQVVSSVPLATRSIFDLLATDAGVAATLTSPSATILQGSQQLNVAGARATSNNYVLNGVDANNFEFHTLASGIVPIPNPDAVQEFRAQTSLYDATSGYSSGANINVITKSGTEEIHGNVYHYLRNDALNANDFFFNKNDAEKPVMIQNQFGGSLGGPVPGTEKAFWFGNYEGMRQKNGIAGSASTSLPVLPAQRDAGSLAAAFGLPESFIDPVAVNILNAPGPYDGKLIPSGTGAAPGQLGSFSFSAPVRFTGNQGNARFDHGFDFGRFTNQLNASYFVSRGEFKNTGGAANGILGQSYRYLFGNDSYSLRNTQVFSGSLLNEFVLGYTWNKRDIEPVDHITIDRVGMSRFNSDFTRLFPNVFFSDQPPCCGSGVAIDQIQRNTSTDIRNMVSWTRGRHSMRFGGQHRRYLFRFDRAHDRGFLFFFNFLADAFFGTPPGVQNLSIRDFLIGAPFSVGVSSGLTLYRYRANDSTLFFQDDFRVTPRLTLNLGLRWDYLGNIKEKNNQISNFDPSLVAPADRLTGGPGLEAGFVIPEGFPQFGISGVSRSTLNSEDKNNLAPRFGFAYDVLGSGRLAVRGGFAFYFMRSSPFSTLQTVANPPMSLSVSDSGFLGLGLLADPFPTLPTPDQFPMMPTFATLQGISSTTDFPVFDGLLISASRLDRDVRDPYTEQWNLTVQHEFLRDWRVELGYLGSRGIGLVSAFRANTPLLRNGNNPGPMGLVTNSYNNRNARGPVVGLSTTSLTFTAFGKSYYHGGLLTVSHPFENGLFFKAAYTYSKSIDNYQANPGFEPGTGNTGNQYLPDLNRGLSNFDQKHRLVITYYYDLPGPDSGWLQHVLGNWSVSGITTFQSGFAGLIGQNVSDPLSGSSGYGLVLPNCDLTASGNVANHLDDYLNADCVSTTPQLTGGQTFGPLSPQEGPGDQLYTITLGQTGHLQGPTTRGFFRNPFQQRWDMSLMKTIPISALGEGGNLQFRAEFFKLFNTPIFSGPASFAGTSSFGRIFSTIDDTGRQMQFALRLSF